MFGEDFVDLLVKEINTYGDNKIWANGTIPKSSHFHKWYHTNQEEFLAFLAVVVNMGLIRKSSWKDYWNLKDWSQSTPFFMQYLKGTASLCFSLCYIFQKVMVKLVN